MKIIITAGGQGTKIWPFSRKESPKQFQKIIGDKSLFINNVEMLLNKFKPEDIFISTKKSYVSIVQKQAPQIPFDNLIIEPNIAKGRGPAEGLAFLTLSIKHPEEPFMLVQADCLYLPSKKYFETVAIMDQVVQKDRKFISGGLKPEFPVLGVDYLELGNRVDLQSDIEFFSVKSFLDRNQSYKGTEKMISERNAVIYTNISCWYPDLMLDAYKKYRPDWYEKLMEIKKVVDDFGKVEKIYSQMEAGVTEDVTRHVLEDGYVVMYPFKWVDIGTWDSIYKYLAKDNEVHVEGNVIALRSSGSLIKSTSKNKLIAVLGLENMVVIDTDDILFIAPRDKAAEIKDVQNELMEKGMERFL